MGRVIILKNFPKGQFIKFFSLRQQRIDRKIFYRLTAIRQEKKNEDLFAG